MTLGDYRVSFQGTEEVPKLDYVDSFTTVNIVNKILSRFR